ncbi:hypothetical protein MY760_09260, partial [Haemophilus influenzae]|nr:hypothetical protein [Haemophilus influenzae]
SVDSELSAVEPNALFADLITQFFNLVMIFFSVNLFFTPTIFLRISPYLFGSHSSYSIQIGCSQRFVIAPPYANHHSTNHFAVFAN